MVSTSDNGSVPHRHFFREALASVPPRLTLTFVALILGLMGIVSIPPVDRDEPYFAQSARQMLESRDFIDIRFQESPHYEKPILTFWLQAASAALFSTDPARNQIWAYRLPSVLAVWLAALLTYEIGLALFDSRAGFAAALILAGMPLVQSQSHQARADALLLAATLGTVLPLARNYARRHSSEKHDSIAMVALFWVSLAAAILIKGPVLPGLLVASLMALCVVDKDWRWLLRLRPSWGIALFLAFLLPWPLAMLNAHGIQFFVEAWKTDILPKLVSGQEGHGAPPLSYLLTSPLTLWPATLFLPSVVQFAWSHRDEWPVRFCIWLVLPGWILFELAPTKLPHYILPLVPALALLVTASARWRTSSSTAVRAGVALFLLSSAALVGIIVWALQRLGPGVDAVSLASLLSLLGAVVIAAVSAWRGGVARSVLPAALCGVLASVVIFGIATPRLERLWVAERAATAALALSGAQSSPIVVGYREPSLVFLLGTRTRFLDARQGVAALLGGDAKVAIVADSEVAAFVEARAHGAQLSSSFVAEGVDPVHGRPIALSVWSATPACLQNSTELVTCIDGYARAPR